ncbi:MAG: hypothetical protein WCP35_11260 [Verrucomicrobiota bacterium]
MSPSAPRKLPITAAEYLDGEARSEIRHEFVDGRIYGMSGASLRHNAICLCHAEEKYERRTSNAERPTSNRRGERNRRKAFSFSL